jgi:hypothetical protein
MTQTRLSSDGRFRWHANLRVWEPIAPIPAGVTTPDGRYRWDGAKWQVGLRPAAEGVAAGVAAPPRNPWVAGVTAAVLVLMGIVIVGVVVLLVAIATAKPTGK